MRRFLVKLVGLVILVILGVSSSFAQDYFGGAQWIGAITRQQAHIPEGRHYQGAVLKESKSLWAKADTLSRRSIILRRSFKPWKTIKKAELRICGLGFYELTINNKKVGDAEFAPLWSDYDKSIFYNLYDVTSYLQLGDNEIRVLLGNGFYNEQGGRYHKLRISFGPPTLKFFLYVIYEDGMRERLLSDENWEWTPSPIVFNSIYGGEDYDARIEPTDWKPVVIQEAPKGLLRKQIAKPVKIILSQDPEAGSKQIKENATIKLTINSKSTKAEVPKVRNYLEQEAIDKLSSKYFTYEIKRVNSTDVSKGYVIECSPQEGTEQAIGTVITLIVSEGKAPEQITVPDVVGKSYESAKSELENAGFTTQKSMVASAVTAGQVILTDPLAGNKLTKGTLITIQVSDGSKIVKGMEQPIDLPQDEYAEIKVTIYVDAVKQEEVSGVPAHGFKKSVYLEPEGAKNHQKTVVVMIDDVRYEAFTFDFKNQTVTKDYQNYDYKVKQGSDPLGNQKDNAIYSLQTYISDMSVYSEYNQGVMYDLIEEYKGYIRNATSESEIEELLNEATRQLDTFEEEVSEEPEESSEEESEEESEEPSKEESEEPSKEESEEQPSVENVVQSYIRQGYADIRHGYEVLFGV